LKPHRQYGLLARHYDDFFTFHQEGYQRARERLLGNILPGVGSACDLACGTGTTAIELARRGIKMFAVDLSPTMCRLAREKAARAGFSLHILRGDMRSFRLPMTVDLITCEFDAVNHVPDRSDFARVARSAARALRPGGFFFFDVNNRKAFERLWGGTWRAEKPGIVLILWGAYDRERDRGWTSAEWFVQSGRYWQRSRERVEEVAWTPLEIRQGLHAAGFYRIRAYDSSSFFYGPWRAEAGCRTFYLAQKKIAGDSPRGGSAR
jgi:SAM-dependent methyltransferase